ncbi:MAG: hypothetical protein IT210_15190 [Armatimonadetes bacterium]|nr:hypothetical protein [Armatimonadota bacterium]
MHSDHADEVASLWEAFARKENDRVPISFACDEQVWLKVSGHGFKEFYMQPEIHLEVQLKGKLWFAEQVRGDMRPGLPDVWTVQPQHWMEEDEFFGCEIAYQENDYAWGKPLDLEKEALLDHLSGLDADERVRRNSAFRLYTALKDLAQGMAFRDRPVAVARPGGSTQGPFTKAAEIRGLEQICIDLYEDPDFARRLLEIVTEKTIERIKAWHRATCGEEPALPSEGGFGFCDDSIQMLGVSQYEEFVVPCHERLYAAMGTGPRSLHLCGRSMQHYRTLKERLGVVSLDGPGPFVDHGYYLEALGPDFTIWGQTDHSVLAQGSPEQIEAMMQGILTSAAKRPGRFALMGFITRDTPLENIRLCYESCRRNGRIESVPASPGDPS